MSFEKKPKQTTKKQVGEKERWSRSTMRRK